MPDSRAIVLPGLKPVLELLAARPAKIKRILFKADWPGAERVIELSKKQSVPATEASADELARLCAGSSANRVSHQGVIAILADSPAPSLRDFLASVPKAPLPLALALDQVQDPANLGAIARAAWAMGCAGIIAPERKSASLGPGAMRASAGALAMLPLCPAVNLARALDEAEEAGIAIFGAGREAGVPCENAFDFGWPLPAILVLGSEEKGIRPGVAKRCSLMLNIPFKRNFDSLNVAQACAMLVGLCAASHSKKQACI